MRVNFNPGTSKLTGGDMDDDPEWLQYLRGQFMESWDLDIEDDSVVDWFYSIEGTKAFLKWLRANDFAAKWWEIQVSTGNAKLAWGIEFRDECPQFVEAKLKT